MALICINGCKECTGCLNCIVDDQIINYGECEDKESNERNSEDDN